MRIIDTIKYAYSRIQDVNKFSDIKIVMDDVLLYYMAYDSMNGKGEKQ